MLFVLGRLGLSSAAFCLEIKLAIFSFFRKMIGNLLACMRELDY